MENPFFEGFLLQASLILALGAQNIFVLESGLKKERNLLVACVCSFCDATLIAIGVLGAATIFIKIPTLKVVFGSFGVLFLAFYAVKKLQESLKPRKIEVAKSESISSVKKVIFLSLGFSLLNPHVYLDTIVLVGGYAAKYSDIEQRSIFGFGAALFSTIWFFGLAFFAQIMSKTLNNPNSMRKVSFFSGLILIFLTWKLGSDVYSWLK
jgi:L-lysine exporter family protein LysE/ArgO